MNSNKKRSGISRLAQTMMAATIVLIVAFQVYWIKNIYIDEIDRLKKETDVMFRETVYKLQVARFRKDTVMFRHFAGDNLFNIEAINVIRKGITDTQGAGIRKPEIIITLAGKDTQSRKFRLRTFTRAIDSAATEEERISMSEEMKAAPLKILKRKSLNDSLSVPQLDSAYRKELDKAGIKIPFLVIQTSESGPVPKKVDGEIKTSPAFVGLMSKYQYQAIFLSPHTFITTKILPQIVFSVVLIALTIGTFVMFYRNLLAQKRITAIKNNFISNMTHELKTPIATVNVAIEALQKFGGLQSPERTSEYLDISAAELQRLSLLVDKVLRLSMFETRDISLQKESFDLRHLSEEVIASMRLQFSNQKALVKLQSQGVNFIIEADKLHIASVIYNLLDNALKYSKDDPVIEVDIIDQSEFIELRISDNGIGIPNEYRSKVFEQFFRIPSGDTHNIKGYGLGLSYVNHIIKRHLGFIELKSDVGKGSTFIVKLPFKEAAVIYYDGKRRVIRKDIALSFLQTKPGKHRKSN